jgi:riboflavin kinase/FMN adenylyltransferase
MIYKDNTIDFCSAEPSAVTLGKFDGLHRGHQKLIGEVQSLQKKGLYGIVFSIAPDHAPVLLTAEEKRSRVEAYGMDMMVRCPFVQEVLSMEPEAFVAEILVRRLNAKYVVVGTDFRFGHNRSGDVGTLQALQEKYGYQVRVIDKLCYHRREISSTYVREVLARGEMELVNRLLGYEYPVRGVVRHGRQLGRSIGMPTINLIPEERKLLPPQGVYFSRVSCGGHEHTGVTNVGYKPTVDGSFLGVETYLYDVNENLYGCDTEVRLLHYSRPEQKFDSVESLKRQMQRDIQAGRDYFRTER